MCLLLSCWELRLGGGGGREGGTCLRGNTHFTPANPPSSSTCKHTIKNSRQPIAQRKHNPYPHKLALLRSNVRQKISIPSIPRSYLPNSVFFVLQNLIHYLWVFFLVFSSSFFHLFWKLVWSFPNFDNILGFSRRIFFKNTNVLDCSCFFFPLKCVLFSS